MFDASSFLNAIAITSDGSEKMATIMLSPDHAAGISSGLSWASRISAPKDWDMMEPTPAGPPNKIDKTIEAPYEEACRQNARIRIAKYAQKKAAVLLLPQ